MVKYRKGLFTSNLTGSLEVYYCKCKILDSGVASVVGKKHDVTNDFLSILMKEGNDLIITGKDGHKFEVIIKEIKDQR